MGEYCLTRRWLIEGWIAAETIIIIGLSIGLMHEFQTNPFMQAWFSNSFPFGLYLLNGWTVAGLSAILTVAAGTLIVTRQRKNSTQTKTHRAPDTAPRLTVGRLIARIKGNNDTMQTTTKKGPNLEALANGFRSLSLTDPYGVLETVLIIFGILTVSVSLFVMKAVALEALGLSCIILGFTAMSLPHELTGSRSMGVLLQGTMLDVEALLEPYPVQRAVYLPPDTGGPVSAFVPLRPSDKPVGGDQMRLTPTRILEKDQSAVLVFPVGAELARLPEIQDAISLEKALQYVLVESTEVCSHVKVEERGDMIVVAMENVKVDTVAQKYLSSLGSIPSSLAACVIAALYKKQTSVIDERGVGHQNIARLRVGTPTHEV